MSSLKNILEENSFKIGIELVSSRGNLQQPKNQKLINFAKELSTQKDLNWISITENAGGNPALSPSIIGKELQQNNKEIIIHLTCKDANRNSIESKLWELDSQHFNNILALTGDYPIAGFKGVAEPVFDIDSINLLQITQQLNNGLEVGRKKKSNLLKTNFYTGAVVSNFKKNENELVPQYLKLIKKVAMGANFIINQVGYDAGKMSELIQFQKYKKLQTHLIGNVFVLSKFTVNLFHQNRIPGVILTKALFDKCQNKISNSTDNGKHFFLELAAKMLAIYKGLGYKGGYLGGVHNITDYQEIIKIFNTYKPTDWKKFVLELQFPQDNEFFLFQLDKNTGLVTENINPIVLEKGKKTKNVNLNYSISKKFHSLLFTKDKGLYNSGKRICESSNSLTNAPNWLYKLEKKGKRILFDCQDCGDCSLQEIAYLCPESQCAKNQRNGPCGGTINSKCEVKDIDCIWARAYDRTKYSGDIWQLLNHTPVLKNSALKNTSSWANYWLGKDHTNH